MKKIFLSVIFVLVSSVAFGDSIVLTNPETINSPTAVKMQWEITRINAGEKMMQIKYKWVDANDDPVTPAGKSVWQIWECRDVPDLNPVANTDCTDAGVPDECCTGAGTGNCDFVDTCFSDVFNFSVRQIDVGTSIGAGLRTLIWNQMKQDVLSGGNDGSFE